MPEGPIIINGCQEVWRRLCQADSDDPTLMPRVTLEAHARHARLLLTKALRHAHEAGVPAEQVADLVGHEPLREWAA